MSKWKLARNEDSKLFVFDIQRVFGIVPAKVITGPVSLLSQSGVTTWCRFCIAAFSILRPSQPLHQAMPTFRSVLIVHRTTGNVTLRGLDRQLCSSPVGIPMRRERLWQLFWPVQREPVADFLSVISWEALGIARA